MPERIQDHRMGCYRPAGQEFFFPYQIPELEPFEVIGKEPAAIAPLPVSPALVLSRWAKGWVGGAQRLVEVFETSRGMLLKVEGGGEFFIAPRGETIEKSNPPEELSQLDREIIAGPALVLALALRGVWSLHASAAIFKNHLIVFLGESREGKSTLAAFLSGSEEADWRLVADDILPVTADSGEAEAWPRFPQLKMSIDEQPGSGLPEHLPLDAICVLKRTHTCVKPELMRLAPGQAVQKLVRHTAGTRLFDPELLAKHLAFCGRVAEQAPVYQLIYPHDIDGLPKVKELLENIC